MWTPLREDDLPALNGLLTAIEHLDEPADRYSLDKLELEFGDADAHPEENAVLGRDSGGTLVAYAWNWPSRSDVSPRRVFLRGGVHPGWRDRGIGRAVLAWQLDLARDWYRRSRQPEHGPLRLIGYAEERSVRKRHLFQRAGLQPVRWYADMSRRLDGELPLSPPPPAVAVVPFTEALLEAVRAAHNEAFADLWGSKPLTREDWQAYLGRPATRPAWSQVAITVEADAGGGVAGELATENVGVVGYAMNSAYTEDWVEAGFTEGWTDMLGVRREWRGRGVARALLSRSMQVFAEAGLDAAGIGVDADTPDAGRRLYRGLGYVAAETVVMHARTERAKHLGWPGAYARADD